MPNETLVFIFINRHSDLFKPDTWQPAFQTYVLMTSKLSTIANFYITSTVGFQNCKTHMPRGTSQ